MYYFLIVALLITAANAQHPAGTSFATCANYQGLYTESSWAIATWPPVRGQFIELLLTGSLSETIVEGDLELRLINSDTGAEANDVGGINLCNAGHHGHNICNEPAGGLWVEPRVFWSPYYPSGHYVLSIIGFADTAAGRAHVPFYCGELSFSFQAPS